MVSGRPPQKPPDLKTTTKVVSEGWAKMKVVEGRPNWFMKAARRPSPKPPDLDHWLAVSKPPWAENEFEMQKESHNDEVRMEAV